MDRRGILLVALVVVLVVVAAVGYRQVGARDAQIQSLQGEVTTATNAASAARADLQREKDARAQAERDAQARAGQVAQTHAADLNQKQQQLDAALGSAQKAQADADKLQGQV